MKKVIAKQSNIEGKGLFAGEDIAAGETIMFFTGKAFSMEEAQQQLAEGETRYDDPFSIGDTNYLILDEIPNYINHSCDPNTGFHGPIELFALRDIKQGEEISYDYSTVVGNANPWDRNWHMECRCGSAICRYDIGTWESIPYARLQFYIAQDALPDFVDAQIAKAPSVRV